MGVRGYSVEVHCEDGFSGRGLTNPRTYAPMRLIEVTINPPFDQMPPPPFPLDSTRLRLVSLEVRVVGLEPISKILSRLQKRLFCPPALQDSSKFPIFLVVLQSTGTKNQAFGLENYF
jgi:hypothetical protein